MSSFIDLLMLGDHNPTVNMILGTHRPNKGKTIVKVLKERPVPKVEDDVPAYENHAIKELNKMLMYGE